MCDKINTEMLIQELRKTQAAVAMIAVSCVRDIGVKNTEELIKNMGLIQKDQSNTGTDK